MTSTNKNYYRDFLIVDVTGENTSKYNTAYNVFFFFNDDPTWNYIVEGKINMTPVFNN